jgi:lysozyme
MPIAGSLGKWDEPGFPVSPIKDLTMKANVLDMFHGDDKELIPNFAVLKQQGIFAIMHKASQGADYDDRLCVARLHAASAAGLLCGVYHFGDASPVEKQWQNFLSVLSKLTFIQPLAQALDFERNSRNTMSLIQAQQFLAMIRAPIIYGSDLVREQPITAKPGPYTPWLWLAEYGPHENIPAPWTKDTTLLWQFSEAGSYTGLQGHVDQNYFDGTAEELAAKWGKPCSTASS